MRFNVLMFFQDYNTERAQTGLWFDGIESLETLNTIILGFENALSALSTAYIPEAIAKAQVFDNGPGIGLSPASSYNRLLFLCKEGQRVASITIPAPATLPVLSAGPLRGYGIDTANPGAAAALQALASALAPTVTPTGQPWPVGEWTAAYMVNPL